MMHLLLNLLLLLLPYLLNLLLKVQLLLFDFVFKLLFKLLIKHLLPLTKSLVNKSELQELINHWYDLHLGLLDLLILFCVCNLLYSIELLFHCLHNFASIELK